MCEIFTALGTALAGTAGAGAGAASLAVPASMAAATAAASTPAWLSYASMGLGALGGVSSAVGTVLQAQAAKASAKYQSRVAQNNAVIAEQQRQDAIQRGRSEEQRRRMIGAQQIAMQRAGYAGAGVGVGEGSPLNIYADTARATELDALTIRSNAEREAMGYQQRAQSFGSESSLLRSSGRQAGLQGWMGAGATLLTSGATLGNRWARYQYAGVI